MTTVDLDLGKYQLGWHDAEEDYIFKPKKGLNEEIIREMSAMKGEPEWMLAFRLKAYERFLRKPVPKWGGGGLLDTIDFDDIHYYVRATDRTPRLGRRAGVHQGTFDKLGIPEAEKKFLAGVGAQYDSRSSTTTSARTSRSRA
jgi:Fe-S cluster assembly protein SufB